jgi:hypothetical protein
VTTWVRLTDRATCGRCGAELADGTAALLIELPGVKHPRVRCEICAGPAPPDLPAGLVRHDSTKKMQPLTKTITAVVDKWLPYKERE